MMMANMGVSSQSKWGGPGFRPPRKPAHVQGHTPPHVTQSIHTIRTTIYTSAIGKAAWQSTFLVQPS